MENLETASTAETSVKTKPALSNKTVLLAALMVVLAIAIAAAVIIKTQQKQDTGIGYATEAKVMLDQESLQAAMDKAMENARDGNVSLSYRNDAYSSDGKNFECYLVNSSGNIYDATFSIFADPELTDELFLSKLVPPGSGFETVTLERALDEGDHTVYVVLTQVKTDETTGIQSMNGQVVYTMDFHVTK
jgi:uncharacterized protein YxeA